MSVTAEVAQPRSDRATAWLYGRRTDLLIGCGLAYVLSIPLLFGLSEATGLREQMRYCLAQLTLAARRRQPPAHDVILDAELRVVLPARVPE